VCPTNLLLLHGSRQIDSERRKSATQTASDRGRGLYMLEIVRVLYMHIVQILLRTEIASSALGALSTLSLGGRSARFDPWCPLTHASKHEYPKPRHLACGTCEHP
jgi:hypothetical protein